MKYSFDYTGEFKEAVELFYTDTDTDGKQTDCPFVWADAKQQLPVLNMEKLELFDKIFREMNCAARVNGAAIEASIDEDELVGTIRLTCSEFDIILGDEDVIRRALVGALKKADVVVIRSVENKVVIIMTVNLKKYLTD